MRTVLLSIGLNLGGYCSFAQPPVPYEPVIKHLLAAGDMPRQARWEDGYQRLILSKLVGNDTCCIYLFCSNTRPHYNYLLLKRSNNYKILSCENLAKEFEIIDEFVNPIKDSITYDHVAALAAWYQANLSRDTAAIRKLPVTKTFQYGAK
ncbi:MAG: hypothetical protein EOP56_06965 [Sphingobacteriales bacterium]|nr:MAG: hypothetical protein EOP56_06965 [Sphingobacteriales bacterium]